MQNLNATLIQTPLIWENSQGNLAHFEKLLIKHQATSDIFILPEMFSTGFSMNPEGLAESMTGATVNWMKTMSSKCGASICGSVIIESGGKFYNRFIWVNPTGELFKYDKKHLFSMAGEDEKYAAGGERIIIHYKGFSICPLVCYDLRFPVWSRNNVGYDLLLYVANWPERRSAHWRSLLLARAIENQCYVIGVNRTGVDGNGFSYRGDSSVIDPAGNILFTTTDEVAVHTENISSSKIHEIRKKLPFLKDQA